MIPISEIRYQHLLAIETAAQELVDNARIALPGTPYRKALANLKLALALDITENGRCSCHLGSICGKACDLGRCHAGCPGNSGNGANTK